jgi:hypothetical protein
MRKTKVARIVEDVKIEKCSHEYTDTKVAPEQYLFPKTTRLVKNLAKVFGGEVNEHIDFQAETHTLYSECTKCGRSMLIENCPTPEMVESCEQVMEYAMRKQLSRNPLYDPVTEVTLTNGETIVLDDLERGVQPEVSQDDIRDVITAMWKANPHTIPEQYIDTVEILVGDKYTREEILDTITYITANVEL